MRFFLFTAPLLWSWTLSGATFSHPAPAPLSAALQDKMPDVLRVLSGDPDLLLDTGAKSRQELEAQARFDFPRTSRLHDIDYQGLDRAGSFAEVVVPTDHYSVPLCVRGSCKTMALFSWSEGGHLEVSYVGRNLQQAAFDSAAKRVAQIPGDLKLVTTDILNYVYVPQKNGEGYLVSATQDQERDLWELSQPGRPQPPGIWRMTLANFREVVRVRAQQHDNSELDDFRPPTQDAPPEASQTTGQTQAATPETPSPLATPFSKAQEAPATQPVRRLSLWLVLGLGVLAVLLYLFVRSRKNN